MISILLLTLAILVGLPVVIFSIEIFACATRPLSASPRVEGKSRPSVAVLVPAHNESAGLSNTIGSIQKQLLANDRLLVVADNCTDDTAKVALAAGAEVIERHDLTKIGKGYALDSGIQLLGSAPPDVVLIIDADCTISENSIGHLAAAASSSGRAAQALYLMVAPNNSSINYKVAEFAWRVKNWLRPLGLMALQLPCQLMGTGMAFPWAVISSAELATGSLVEDMKLGLDLAAAKTPPLFCPAAIVTSQFPSTAKGADAQRTRWEQGHMGMISSYIPRLLLKGLVRGNLNLLALAMDAAVPPLTMLAILVAAMLALSAVGYYFWGAATPALISGADFLVFSLALVVCWLKCGRDVLPLHSIFSIALYGKKKVSLYSQMLSSRKNLQWIRADRDIERDG